LFPLKVFGKDSPQGEKILKEDVRFLKSSIIKVSLVGGMLVIGYAITNYSLVNFTTQVFPFIIISTKYIPLLRGFIQNLFRSKFIKYSAPLRLCV